MKLKTYSGAPLEVKGRAQVEVRYQGQEASLPLLVVAGEGPSLLGQDAAEIGFEIDLQHPGKSTGGSIEQPREGVPGWIRNTGGVQGHLAC